MNPCFVLHPLNSFVVFFLIHLNLTILPTTPEKVTESKQTLQNPYSNSSTSEDVKSRSLEAQILHQIFNASRYDNQLRPKGTNNSKGPVEVSLRLLVKSIEDFDDVRRQFIVGTTFRQEWVDPRLSYSHLIKPNISFIYLSLSHTDYPIWIPNVFFTNEKSGYMHDLMIPNVVTRIYPSGKVFHAGRFTLTLSCPMDLYYFPFDEHYCPIEMQSYGWSTKDLVLKWHQIDPIIMPSAIEMPKFKVIKYKFGSGCLVFHPERNFSCAKVEILFDRRYSLYLVQFYFPSTLLCVISWIGVLLDPHEVGARVSLGITTSLSAVFLSSTLNHIAPATSYVRVIDVWLLFCQGMVISVLVEFSVVNYFTTHVVNSQIREFVLPYTQLVGYEQWKTHKVSQFLAQATHKASLVDKVARFLYPLVFITFASTYWIGFTFLLDHHHTE